MEVDGEFFLGIVWSDCLIFKKFLLPQLRVPQEVPYKYKLNTPMCRIHLKTTSYYKKSQRNDVYAQSIPATNKTYMKS